MMSGLSSGTNLEISIDHLALKLSNDHGAIDFCDQKI